MSLRSAATSKSGNLYQEAFLILHRFRPGQTVHCMVVCTHPKLFHKMSCSFRLTENCLAKACACFQTRAMRTTWFVKLFLWGLDSHFTWKSQSQLLRTDVCINIWVLQEQQLLVRLTAQEKQPKCTKQHERRQWNANLNVRQSSNSTPTLSPCN